MFALRQIALAFVAMIAFGYTTPANSCPNLAKFANSSSDASRTLNECIQETAKGARLEIPPGTYRLRRQIKIEHEITISSQGVTDSAPACAELPPRSCAIFVIDLIGRPNPSLMPIEVTGDGVTLIHLVVEGTGSPSPNLRADCSNPDLRPLGGGLRIRASTFTLRKSILRNFACYTTIEALGGINSLVLEDNQIGPNGDHRRGGVWSDGITILDASASVVRRNIFIDNTDVQLILGGCQRCTIEDNRFHHRGDFAGASFAELMLQAFPSTSGNYTGTVVRRNIIDCGPRRRCGYGIMIGANPWKDGDNPHYPGAMFGGSITRNIVRNAMIGINIDAPTGITEVRANRVERSGGVAKSDCGTRDWPAVNVAPRALRLVRGAPSNQSARSVTTSSCMINRDPH